MQFFSPFIFRILYSCQLHFLSVNGFTISDFSLYAASRDIYAYQWALILICCTYIHIYWGAVRKISNINLCMRVNHLAAVVRINLNFLPRSVNYGALLLSSFIEHRDLKFNKSIFLSKAYHRRWRCCFIHEFVARNDNWTCGMMLITKLSVVCNFTTGGWLLLRLWISFIDA